MDFKCRNRPIAYDNTLVEIHHNFISSQDTLVSDLSIFADDFQSIRELGLDLKIFEFTMYNFSYPIYL